MFFEYGTLGLLAGVIGALGSQVLTFLLSSEVLDIPYRPAVAMSSLAIVLAAVAVSVVGVIVTLDVVRHKPLTILRVG
jgi:predicted lysophospholipase L1 biosynthesis ABC-type transport system permease subunit